MVSWPMVGRGQRRNLSQKVESVKRKTSVSLQPSGVSCTSHACQTDTTNAREGTPRYTSKHNTCNRLRHAHIGKQACRNKLPASARHRRTPGPRVPNTALRWHAEGQEVAAGGVVVPVHKLHGGQGV